MAENVLGGVGDGASLRAEMEAALAAGRIADYCRMEDKYEDLVADAAGRFFAAGQFETCAGCYEEARVLNAQLITVLTGQPASGDAAANHGDEDADPIAAARTRAPLLEPRWEGMRDYVTALGLRIAMRPLEAVAAFESAAAAFDRVGPSAMARTARASVAICRGIENLRRANFTIAAASFQQAQVQFEALEREQRDQADPGAAPPVEGRPESAPQGTDALSCELLYRMAASRASLMNGNYDSALTHATELCDVAERVAGNLGKDGPAWMVASAATDVHSGKAWLEQARAEVARRDEQWTEAISGYRGAQVEFQRAAAAFAATGLPQAEANQESMLNQSAALDMMIRQTEQQRDSQQKLLVRIRDLEGDLSRRDEDVSGFLQTLSSHGVQVTNINEATAQVDLDLQIVVQVENHVREQLESLRREVDAGGMDDQTKKLLTDKANEALSDEQHGPAFLQHVATVAGQLAEIVKSASVIAGPIPLIVGNIIGLVGKAAGRA